jgi:glutamyl-tRNA synthetase
MKVRFAPSPTGYLHIGGARTALFNWMYARSQGGTFILRIEDTDLTRSKPEFSDEILKGLEWLGLKWDEFYRQSERFAIYREYAEKLLQEGKAYNEGRAVILRMPEETVKLFDMIRGEIVFEPEALKDEVLMKSDGTPTYNFSCAVDDALMGITHVIRGEDHISNTPKQIQMYKALGLNVPKFAHLPLILGSDGTRMSKRTGAVAVSDYQAMGFLPEALVNYLMLLGWSPGDNQEVIKMDSALKKFSIKKINKAAAMFSMDKLKWINQQYIKQTAVERLVDLLVPFLKAKGFLGEQYDRQRLIQIVKLYQGRLATLTDFLERADYLFSEQIHFEPEARNQFLTPDKAPGFQRLSERLRRADPFDAVQTEKVFREVVEELGVESGALVHPVRVALTGKAVGLGLFETMTLLGKEKTITRLEQAFAK